MVYIFSTSGGFHRNTIDSVKLPPMEISRGWCFIDEVFHEISSRRIMIAAGSRLDAIFEGIMN